MPFAAEDARINIQKLNFYLYGAWKPPSACRRIDAARSIGGQAQAAKVISLTLALTRCWIISGRTVAETGTKCHSAASCLEGICPIPFWGVLRAKASLSETRNAISNVNCELILLQADVAGCLFEWVSRSLRCKDMWRAAVTAHLMQKGWSNVAFSYIHLFYFLLSLSFIREKIQKIDREMTWAGFALALASFLRRLRHVSLFNDHQRLNSEVRKLPLREFSSLGFAFILQELNACVWFPSAPSVRVCPSPLIHLVLKDPLGPFTNFHCLCFFLLSSSSFGKDIVSWDKREGRREAWRTCSSVGTLRKKGCLMSCA